MRADEERVERRSRSGHITRQSRIGLRPPSIAPISTAQQETRAVIIPLSDARSGNSCFAPTHKPEIWYNIPNPYGSTQTISDYIRYWSGIFLECLSRNAG